MQQEQEVTAWNYKYKDVKQLLVSHISMLELLAQKP